MTRQYIMAAAARACIGTPFHHQGRAMGAGLDCIGLVVHVLRACDETIDDCTDYGRRPEGQRLVAALLAHGFIEVSDICMGDVLLFRFNGQPQHVGLAVAADRMVHAYAPLGRVVETRLGASWRRRLAGVYRL